MRDEDKTKEQLVEELCLLRRRIAEMELPGTESRGPENGVEQLRQKITEREEEVESLARFPAENPNPVLRLSRDGLILYANEASKALLCDWGSAVGSYAPQPWRDLTVEVLANRSSRIVDLELGERLFSFTVMPVVSAGYANWYGSDITERKRVEEELRDIQVFLTLLLDHAPMSIYATLADGRMRLVNRRWQEDTQLRREDVIGRPLEQIFPIDAALKFRADNQRVIDTGAPLMFEETASAPVAPRHFLTVKFPLYDKSGQAGGVGGISLDITERKRAEEALRESEDFLNTLLDAIPIPVFYKDRNGRYLRVNRAFEAHYGAPREQLIGKTVFDICPPELAKIFHAKDVEVFDNREVQQYESQLVRAHGELRNVIFSKAIVTDSQGAISGLIGTILDITERKRAEEALRESEERVKKKLEQITSPDVEVEDISLLDLIELEELQQIQDSFALANNVAALITDMEGNPITAPSNFTDVCKMIRNTEKGSKNCVRSDRIVGSRAEELKSVVYVECLSCGFVDGCAPIIVGGKQIASWLIGQSNPMGVDRNRIEEYAREIGADVEAMSSAFDRMPHMSLEQFERVVDLLWKFAEEISSLGYKNLQLAKDAARREKVEKEREQLIDILNRLTAVMDNTSDLVAISTLEGRVTYINPAGKRMVEQAEGDHAKLVIADYHPPEVAEKILREYIPVVLEKGGWSGETALQRADGTTIPVSQVIMLIRNEAGEPEAFGTIMRDISERKRTEGALRESEERLRLKLDSLLSPDVDVLDQELSNIIDIPALQSLMDDFYKLTNMGSAILDLKGKVLEAAGWQDICTRFHRVHPETARNCTESDLFLARNVKPGEHVAYKCKNGLWDVVTPLYIGDKYVANIYTGQFFYEDEEVDEEFFIAQAEKYGFDKEQYLADLRRVQRYSREAVDVQMRFLSSLAAIISNLSSRNIALAKSIVEQKQIAEELIRSEERYRALYRDNPSMLFTLDAEGTVISVNEFGASQLGYTIDGLEGQSVLNVFYEADKPAVVEQLKKCLQAPRQIHRWQFRKVHKNGNILWVDEFARAMIGPDGALNVLVVCNDITEQQKLEAQLRQAQKMEAVGRLAGGVAHDFNNLLTSIIGYSSLVLNRLGDLDPLREDVEQIMKATRRAASLTGQLLAFSRRQMLQPKVLDLNASIADMTKMLGRLIGEDIELITDLAPDLKRTQADSGQIGQVILNLAINARDAMPQGGRLTIKTENVTLDEECSQTIPRSRPGRFIRMSVTDTGIGMDEDVLEHIFEPFFTTKQEGAGLGLAVAHGIVGQHEGWINVYSEPGRGSTFRVYLPALDVGKGEEVEEEVVPVHKLQGHGERILVVEDEEGVREFATKALDRNGYVPFGAASVREALVAFEREEGRFHLVFSDVVLPDSTGLQLIEQLLSYDPALPVLLSSGYADQKSQWLLIREKGFRFVRKPYSLADLLQAVREALNATAS